MRGVERFNAGHRVIEPSRRHISQPQLLLQPRQIRVIGPGIPPVLDFRLTRLHQTMTLGIGELDPVTEPSGVRMRLSLLGLYSGPLSGALDGMASRALLRFQHEQGLEETGQPNDATRDALVRAVGC